MNDFYKQSAFVQWTVSILMFIASGFVMYSWILLMEKSIVGILYIFIATPVTQFLISPIMKMTKVYSYLSPMLLVYAASDKKYDLHNGTTFDYIYAYKRKRAGIRWQNQLLMWYIEGLLVIADRLKEGSIPKTIEIRGSSYFFSERTAQRMGFRVGKTGAPEKMNLAINYLDLLWMYSLAKGKLTFPNLSAIKTASTSGGELLENEEKLRSLLGFLEKRK